jgi:hypothetical protein
LRGLWQGLQARGTDSAVSDMPSWPLLIDTQGLVRLRQNDLWHQAYDDLRREHDRLLEEVENYRELARPARHVTPLAEALRRAVASQIWSTFEGASNSYENLIGHGCSACSHKWGKDEEEKHQSWCWVPMAKAALKDAVRATP